MKAIYSAADGGAKVMEVTAPRLARGQVRIAAHCSLISPGTERHYAANAAARGESIPLGYCSAGTVVQTADVPGLQVGDRVIAMGWGYAYHAEQICVPWRLCRAIQGDLAFEQAVFAGLFATALHACQRAASSAMPLALVVGAGMVGQLVAQCARLGGAQVLLADGIEQRVRRAPAGIEPIVAAAGSQRLALTKALAGRCPSVVYLCSSGDATAALAEVLALLAAGDAQRRRAVIVVGRLSARVDFSADLGNLDVRVSSRCGSGYRDDDYVHGRTNYAAMAGEASVDDNLARGLQWLEQGALAVTDLHTHRFSIDDAPAAYEALQSPAALGVTLHYAPHYAPSDRRTDSPDHGGRRQI